MPKPFAFTIHVDAADRLETRLISEGFGSWVTREDDMTGDTPGVIFSHVDDLPFCYRSQVQAMAKAVLFPRLK